MPTKGWGQGTEKLNAVQECVIKHLTTEKSLAFLESKGFKMSESKFRKIKKYIRESTPDRLDSITHDECVNLYLDDINTMQLLNTRLWEFSRENKGTKEELIALGQISQNVKILEDLYEAAPLFSSLLTKLKEN
jgi:hypothetical protein